MNKVDKDKSLKRILNRMDDLGQTPQALSIAIGRDRGYVRDLKRSLEQPDKKFFPKHETLVAIARELDCSVNYLLLETDELNLNTNTHSNTRNEINDDLENELMVLITSVIELADECQNRFTLPPEKWAEFALLVLKSHRRRGAKLDPATVKASLDMAIGE
ncbi:MAG: hypothetical protein OQJ97_06925 [Rhodospirillales bacterium]|nr:hypothetical protein [Rhodospirillales bacterium]